VTLEDHRTRLFIRSEAPPFRRGNDDRKAHNACPNSLDPWTRPRRCRSVIYILDILGVFAFSFLGACTALQGRLNVIGVLTCAFLSALGGGTIREVMLNRIPFYFHDCRYLLTVLLASMMAWIIRERLPLLRHVMPVLDAIGLVVFAYIGARAATHAHLGLSGMLLFALLTAIGGGILSDLVAHRTPQVFQNARYATPPILLAVLYWYLAESRDQPFTVPLLLISAFAIRMLNIYGRTTLTGKLSRANIGLWKLMRKSASHRVMAVHPTTSARDRRQTP
jgi:uncharacterized membrane protein YeiH